MPPTPVGSQHVIAGLNTADQPTHYELREDTDTAARCHQAADHLTHALGESA